MQRTPLPFGLVAAFVVAVSSCGGSNDVENRERDAQTDAAPRGGRDGGATLDGGAAAPTRSDAASDQADGARGGSAGAGGTLGAGGAAGTNGAACPNRIFCDDFEDDVVGSAPGAPWKVSTNPAGGAKPSLVVIDGSRARGGSKSVRASAAGGFFTKACFGLTTGSVAALASQTTLYGRAMIYMPKAAGGFHTTMIQGSGPLPGATSGMSHYKFGHTLDDRFMVNYAGPLDTCNDCSVVSSVAHPADKWACIEWQWDTATSTQRYWLDGVELADAHATLNGSPKAPTQKTWPAPRLESIEFGWETYILDLGPAEIWFDDVALDDQRIGCP